MVSSRTSGVKQSAAIHSSLPELQLIQSGAFMVVVGVVGRCPCLSHLEELVNLCQFIIIIVSLGGNLNW